MEAKFRVATGEEQGAVLEMWRRNYRGSHHARHRVEDGTYDTWMRKRIHRLISHAIVLLACDPEDETVIWGWICGERAGQDALCVHYAYVKKAFQRQGLGWALLFELTELCDLDASVRNRYYTHRRAPYTRPLDSQGWVFAPKLAS